MRDGARHAEQLRRRIAVLRQAVERDADVGHERKRTRHMQRVQSPSLDCRKEFLPFETHLSAALPISGMCPPPLVVPLDPLTGSTSLGGYQGCGWRVPRYPH